MIKHVVILAGGTGTRLWPASLSRFPKQFINLGQGNSLFQSTIERALSLDITGIILIVTHEQHVEEISRQCRNIPDRIRRNRKIIILPESVGKNTAPAIVYACAFLKGMREEKNSLIVLPSDHYIEPFSDFKNDIIKASCLAEKDFIVSFGIPAQGPDTGYGYIETGKEESPGYITRNFHEKPDYRTALRYFKKNNFFWNSGMFTFKVDIFLKEVLQFAPSILSPFSELTIETQKKESVLIPLKLDSVKHIYKKLPSISVDYAIMEKSLRSAMVKASFRWSDAGSWDEISKTYKGETETVFQSSSGENFVFSDIPVALAGVKDLIVVVKNNMALICKKGSSQLVRDIVQNMKDKNRQDLL